MAGPFAMRGILKGQSISAERIPTLLASAVTAVEDRRFYQHGGIDVRAITRAAWHDLTGRRLEGGSTITQQLARRLYLSPDRTLKRKVQEAVLAEWLDLTWSKNKILADYLNTAYFGDGAYGAEFGGATLLRQERATAVAQRGGNARGPHQSAVGA